MLPSNRIRAETPAAAARAVSSPARSPVPAIARTGLAAPSTSGNASIRYSKPFLRTSRPAVKISGVFAGTAIEARTARRALRRRARTLPYPRRRGRPQCARRSAPSPIARRARSSLHAVTAPARPKTRRATARAVAMRSATKTSEPCRLTTSGRWGARRPRSRRRARPSGRASPSRVASARRACALNQPAAHRQRRGHPGGARAACTSARMPCA